MAATKILNWIIYVLKCPRTRQVRYVGWTSHSPKRRLTNHIYDALGKSRQTHRGKWVMSLLGIGIMPVLEIIESGTGDGWAEAEQRWIAHYRAAGARLVNATDGGEGMLGWGTPEQRREMAIKRRAKQVAHSTPEQRSASMRKAQAGLTPERRRASMRKAQAVWLAQSTHEQRSANAIKWHAGRTPEQRSEVMRRWQMSKPLERRREEARKRNEGMTPEARSARTKAGHATRMKKVVASHIVELCAKGITWQQIVARTGLSPRKVLGVLSRRGL